MLSQHIWCGFYPANWIDKHTVDVIEPLGLRAPEVILGSGWGPSAEIWGLGCIVRSFYFTGEGGWDASRSGLFYPEAGW